MTYSEKMLHAVIERDFAGRFFAVGSTFTKDVLGKVGTMNEALDDLDRYEQSGNGGSAINILEVDANGNYIEG